MTVSRFRSTPRSPKGPSTGAFLFGLGAAGAEGSCAPNPATSGEIVHGVERLFGFLDGHLDFVPLPILAPDFVRTFDPAGYRGYEVFPGETEPTAGNELAIATVGTATAGENLERWALADHELTLPQLSPKVKRGFVKGGAWPQ